MGQRALGAPVAEHRAQVPPDPAQDAGRRGQEPTPPQEPLRRRSPPERPTLGDALHRTLGDPRPGQHHPPEVRGVRPPGRIRRPATGRARGASVASGRPAARAGRGGRDLGRDQRRHHLRTAEDPRWSSKGADPRGRCRRPPGSQARWESATTTWSSPRPVAARSATACSGSGSGIPPSRRLASTAFSSTIYATARSPCGSQLGQAPPRSLSEPATPASSPCWIVTATCCRRRAMS